MVEIRRRGKGWLLLAILALMPAGCATNPVTGQDDFVLMSEEQELGLGRQEHPNILKQFGKYEDAALQAYVQQVGEKVAATGHRHDLIYHFTVLDSTDVNAFALPGGYIYITRGLLAYLNSEAELAAVLGHEIGHVTARHGVRQYSAAMAANLGMALGALLVPELGSEGAQDLFNLIGTALLRGYGRDHELEADRLGAEYLARSGYDPQAMIQVIRVLKNQELFEVQLAREENREPHVYHGVFSTHPDNDQRLQQVVGAANRLKAKTAPQPVPRTAFLQRLENMTFGPGAREGVLRGRDFYHRDLDFTLHFPAGWKVDNLSDRLVATAPRQVALLQVQLEDLNKRMTPERYLKERFNLSTLSQGAVVNEHGLDGYTGVATLRTSLGERDSRVAARFHNRQAYLFVGFAKANAGRAQYDDAFLATIRSMRPLSPEERRLAEPLRIRLVPAKAGITFRQLATQSRIQHHAEEQLRLMNDRYPGGEPSSGELIKIVE